MLQKEAYTPKEVSHIIGCHVNTVYNWVAKGLLPAVKVGRVIRVPRQVLERILSAGLPKDCKSGELAVEQPAWEDSTVLNVDRKVLVNKLTYVRHSAAETIKIWAADGILRVAWVTPAGRRRTLVLPVEGGGQLGPLEVNSEDLFRYARALKTPKIGLSCRKIGDYTLLRLIGNVEIGIEARLVEWQE